jgi:hypothetical protein
MSTSFINDTVFYIWNEIDRGKVENERERERENEHWQYVEPNVNMK